MAVLLSAALVYTSFSAASDEVTGQLAGLFQARDAAVVGLAQQFVTRSWPAQFRFIVSPMVTWIWLGALVIALGALIALVPVRRAPRRASTSEAVTARRSSGG